MDLIKELEEVRQRKQKALSEIRELDQNRQQKLQEALRIEGEIRMLERLSKNTDKQKGG